MHVIYTILISRMSHHGLKDANGCWLNVLIIYDKHIHMTTEQTLFHHMSEDIYTSCSHMHIIGFSCCCSSSHSHPIGLCVEFSTSSACTLTSTSHSSTSASPCRYHWWGYTTHVYSISPPPCHKLWYSMHTVGLHARCIYLPPCMCTRWWSQPVVKLFTR